MGKATKFLYLVFNEKTGNVISRPVPRAVADEIAADFNRRMADRGQTYGVCPALAPVACWQCGEECSGETLKRVDIDGLLDLVPVCDEPCAVEQGVDR
jgi:hypothetical protein